LEDIEILVKKFINKFNMEYGRNVTNISKDALNILTKYNWPGNVRELENIIGRAMINMDFNEIIISKIHIPLLISEKDYDKKNKDFEKETIVNSYKDLNDAKENFERKYIAKVYKDVNKNKTKTAEKLNISIRSLYYKLDKYKIS